MSFADRFATTFKRLLPAPFTIAVVLTLFTFAMAWLFTEPDCNSKQPYLFTLMGYWETGLWNNGLLVFAMQMMLMLVLGHILALSRPVNLLIKQVVQFCKDTPTAAALVTLLTVLVSLFNWGLGLIFGAILARKVAEHALANGIRLNYPLIGAAGYSGLMVWHGGLSGFSLAKVAEPGHLKSLAMLSLSEDAVAQLPEVLSFSETVFSPLNLAVSALLIVVLPLGMYLLGRTVAPGHIQLQARVLAELEEEEPVAGAERLDQSYILGIGFGLFVATVVVHKLAMTYQWSLLDFFNPNNINLLLLSLALLLHGRFTSFLRALEDAIGGAAGILIQFPLYFGIMGIMSSSGMVTQLSQFFVSISNATTYPLYTFLSAGLVNIFVPSGGGQWAIQGPIIIISATDLGLSLPKSILAMAYGDQLTNMLQPFWALPLLGITGLKAREILPYTLYLLLLGVVIFVLGLVVF